MESIVRNGAVVSEYPCGTAPLKRHFPERNRVIASLSWATVVVEAARDSGSLITADLAADEGRAVYAVPGSLDEPNAFGTNGLLRAGALVCRSAADVLEDLAPQIVEAASTIAAKRPGVRTDRGPVPGTADLTQDEIRVLERLPGRRGIGIEKLGELCGLSPGPLQAALLELELKGLARQLPGRRFQSAACKI